MDFLKLYMITFNCARNLIEPAIFASHLFDGWEDPSSSQVSLPDLIVFHLQEIAPLGYAFLGHSFVKPYLHRFRTALKIASDNYSEKHKTENLSYLNITAHNCGLTGLLIFAKDELAHRIHTVNIAEVGVGVSEMGNKGAVGARIGWQLNEPDDLLYLTFVSAHLAPFEEEVEHRNQDYCDIAKGLVFDSKNTRKWRSEGTNSERVPLLHGNEIPSEVTAGSPKGIYSDDSYLFFGGDLNYRTGLTGPTRGDNNMFPQPRKDATDSLHFSHLLEKDQLTQQRQQKQTLQGLTEQAVDFPPTYKYKDDPSKPVTCDNDVQRWNWSSHRWPSWCDRILFSSTSSLRVNAGRYTALPIFRTSDHRPVALSAVIPLRKIEDSAFAASAPSPIDRTYQVRRDAARRKEIAVGVAAYLGWTWEGNSLVLGTIVAILGAIWIAQSLS